LYEASQIDGCGDFRYFFFIILPLSKAIMAVLALYYGVYHWNSWFRAMLYIRNPDMQPLQLVLRSILIIAKVDVSQLNDPDLVEQLQYLVDLIKYALIVVATIPVIAVYPLVQRYFIKGVMIGSLKG
jgi:multiple sugar transport system permease protein/putative aldouronate transport system permease protein